jgi:tRNA (guanosine-2'-O-)-methyltransferase
MSDEILSQFLLPERIERLENALANRTNQLTVVLDRVRNYHNVSAVVRSSDAFGLSTVHMVGKYFEYASGISLGAEKWTNIKRYSSPEDAITTMKAEGYAMVVLQPENFAVPVGKIAPMSVSELPFNEKLALVFGNEKRGVDPLFQKEAKYFAYIPMYGFVESLNISVACAITLFCSTIAKSAPTKRTQGLSEQEAKELKSHWLKQDVKNSEIILREVERRTKFNDDDSSEG